MFVSVSINRASFTPTQVLVMGRHVLDFDEIGSAHQTSARQSRRQRHLHEPVSYSHPAGSTVDISQKT